MRCQEQWPTYRRHFASLFVSNRKLRFMPECSSQQDDLCYGRKLHEQGSSKDVWKSRVSNMVPTSISKYLKGCEAILFPSRLSVTSTYGTRNIPRLGEQYTLEFDIKSAGIAGIAWNVDTLIKHKWNARINWAQPIVYQKHGALFATLQCMGLTHLPISKTACIKAVSAMEHIPRNFSHSD